jgi:hypothetical protein
MPKKNWDKPEKRIRIGVNVTSNELRLIDENASTARLERAVFLRYAGMQTPLSKAPKIASMDEIRYARLLGSLNDLGSRLNDLVEILEADEMPAADHWRVSLSKLQYLVEEISKALGVQV